MDQELKFDRLDIFFVSERTTGISGGGATEGGGTTGGGGGAEGGGGVASVTCGSGTGEAGLISVGSALSLPSSVFFSVGALSDPLGVSGFLFSLFDSSLSGCFGDDGIGEGESWESRLPDFEHPKMRIREITEDSLNIFLIFFIRPP